MKPTLYISDLDGTLLNSKSIITSETASTLNYLLQHRGLMFSVATARTPATVVNLLSRINTTLPQIVMTGAAMWQNGKGLVNRRYMMPDRVEFILKCCRERGIRPFVYCYNEEDRIIEAYHSPAMSSYEYDFATKRNGTPYKRFIYTNSIPAKAMSRAMLIFAAERYERMNDVYLKVQAELPCAMTFYRDIYGPETGLFEVMAEGVSKAAAIRQLAEQTDAERIVVFGDSPNDLSMREIADCFIAPANAAADVLKVADEIIGSNDNDSVAKRIDKDF